MRVHPKTPLCIGVLILGSSLAAAPPLFANGDKAVAAPAPAGAGPAAGGTAALAGSLGISFVDGSSSTLVVERDGKKYLVDLVARTIREGDARSETVAADAGKAGASGFVADQRGGADIFKQKCSACHGVDGKGIKGIGTPNFTDPKLQASITDEQVVETIKNGKKGTMMPAWAGKLSDQEISAVATYIRSFAGAPRSRVGEAQVAKEKKPGVYEPGDDVVFSLPTGRRLDRHGFYVNFAHRFPFDPAFSGTARGGGLFGLDGLAVPSFGFRYGVTDKFSVGIWRSPTILNRPIQLTAAYNFLDEHDGKPLNLAVRVSLEGQNDLRKNFTENIEGIFSRSLTSRAQIYIVPTVSINDRRLVLNPETSGFESNTIPNLPAVNAFSLGVGLSVDIRPTVALVAEVIPTLVNGNNVDPNLDLGIHRPAYSFGIQKKIWRHAFTFGFTTGPGTTISQRAGPRATLLGDPTADKPSGLVIGFDLTRQIF